MNAEQILAQAMKMRTERGLCLRVYGLSNRPEDEPFVVYPKDEEQKAKWVASYKRKGARVEIA